MSSDTAPHTPREGAPSEANSYTQAPLGTLYLRTAPPVILVLGMNGLLTVVDALFLGAALGADALTAVTLTFPIQMLLNGVAMAISSGLSSLLARHLGAERFAEARRVLMGAQGLALTLGCGLILVFLGLGRSAGEILAGGPGPIATMALTYLFLTILGVPVMLLLAVNSEALRDEGRTLAMAAAGLFVSLTNIALNALFILGVHWGVAGSALGTLAAQVLALTLILVHRNRVGSGLRLGLLPMRSVTAAWKPILVLGGPRGLNFMGISLVSGVILWTVRAMATPHMDATIAAYGVITRVMTFLFLPLLGLAQAMQSIVGNNSGAGAWTRANHGLTLGLGLALAYCVLGEAALVGLARPIGALFVTDPVVIAEVGRILPRMAALFVATGPLLLLATYFQAIGKAGQAALLSLAKPYILSLPLTLILPLAWGEPGIWLAAPLAEGLMVLMTLLVLTGTARGSTLRWGLFQTPVPGSTMTGEARP